MPASNQQKRFPEYSSPFRILIVDDDDVVLTHYQGIFQRAGFTDVLLCMDSRLAADHLAQNDTAIVFLDLSMPHISGMELMDIIKTEYPQIPIAVITMADEVETAVECMRKGALDYLVKPIEPNRLVKTAERAMEEREIRKECAALKKGLLSDAIQNSDAFSEIITNSRNMKAIFRYVEAIASSRRPVQITGETGVGKELMALAIHTVSRVPGSFIAVNIAGLDDNLLSDTLFGHEKGAYTGAETSRTGLVEEAENGTLFLDEIGDLSPTSQIKLLRLIQEKEYLPLGASAPKSTNIRVITATHCDMEKEMLDRRFRKDLFYRFQTHHILIPPLRERLDDLPLLANHFVLRAAEHIHQEPPVVSSSLLDVLASYTYPGNIRELDAMLFDAVTRHEYENDIADEIQSYIARRQRHVSESYQLQPSGSAISDYISLLSRCQTLPNTKEAGEALVLEAMRRADQNQTLAAGMIGLSSSALSRRVKSIE